jgi:hypothetical protein
LQSQQPDIVLTSEELRVAALSASTKRGKWVARRRVFRRWLAWVSWTFLLPVIGLAAVVACLFGLVFWQYTGHAAAYTAAQQWVQQEFGSFSESGNTPAQCIPEGVSLITLTQEATPILQIDRNLSVRTGNATTATTVNSAP